MPNLLHTYIAIIKSIKARTGEGREDSSCPHGQDGNVAVDGIGNLAR